MFHKALWMRQWKQGKYIILLFWLSSLYSFPYQYYNDAQSQLRQSKMQFEDYLYYYSYSFTALDGIVIQIIILIALACLLIGWERNNQSTDFLLSMPFKRKDIFLTKWLFGVLNIIIVNIICWISMYGIKNVSFHDQYQTFTSFHTYFLYATVVLITIYTFGLFVGTITGNIISQSSLTVILLYLPYGLILLISGFIYTHTRDSVEALGEIERKTHEYLQHVSAFAPLDRFNINYNYHPIEFDEQGNKIPPLPQKNPMEHTFIPSAWKLLTPFTYIIIFYRLQLFYTHVLQTNKTEKYYCSLDYRNGSCSAQSFVSLYLVGGYSVEEMHFFPITLAFS